MLPTLPQYIKKVNSSTERVFKSLVIPVVIPTVPIAEKASNKESVTAIPLVELITNVPTRAKIRLIAITVTAFLSAESLSFLEKQLGYFPRTKEAR